MTTSQPDAGSITHLSTDRSLYVVSEDRYVVMLAVSYGNDADGIAEASGAPCCANGGWRHDGEGAGMTQLYKVTGPKGEAFYGGTGHWTPGRWRSVRGPLVPCEHGLHVITVAQLPQWLGPAIWRVETDGELVDAGDKLVARRARITERVEAWDERTARLFLADCAEHVLPLFERIQPTDPRPREAIAVARRYANGEATRKELAAAGAAAWAAARAAARAAEVNWQARHLADMLSLPWDVER